ncbi:MAG: 6-phosphogluconolactonase [Desulfuromonadales bacterium]|nr:6-phosphogluconolactonase [Desulfuromonadales bacterium]
MIKVFSTIETLSTGIAELFASAAEQAVASQGRFSALLSGGETPRRTYELLAQEPFRQRIPWNSIHLFWGDERCVADTDPRSNAHVVRQTLLDRVPMPERQIHPITCDGSPQTAASAYETSLRSHFSDDKARFDLVMLGLGDDGHTASLFPGTAALREQHHWVIATQKPGEDIMRVTVTIPLLNQAGLVVFLVAGPGKASVLRRVLEGPLTPDLFPAQRVKPVDGGLLWYVEESAARLLSPGIHTRGKM